MPSSEAPYDACLTRLPAPQPPPGDHELGNRFTVFADSGVVELHCTAHSPYAVIWRVGYHPSLDVLIEQARAHNAEAHDGRTS